MFQTPSSGSVWMGFRATLNLADQRVTGITYRSVDDPKATEKPTVGMMTLKPAPLEPLPALRQQEPLSYQQFSTIYVNMGVGVRGL